MLVVIDTDKDSRLNEWFVPKFGPLKFRLAVGLLFLPYTFMCISFTILGSILSPVLYIDRLISISIIYFLSLGIAAHLADSIGSKKVKPWGKTISKKRAWMIIIICLSISYVLGSFYIIFHSPLLLVVAVAEGFFLFAYNLELFKGLFHNNFWFSISWGMLPFLAGYVIQANSFSSSSILISILPAIISYVEITISRQYKILKRQGDNSNKVKRSETYLKIISLGTILITMFLLILKV